MGDADSEVLIAGAGPVGLVLAMDLAMRGVAVTVVEPRARLEPPSVRCNHVSARSMEIFRRLGIVAEVRAAGLPEDYPNDVVYRITATGEELARIPIPCRRDRYLATGGPDTGWPTAEPPHRINQIYLEPILFAAAEARPGIRILNRWRLHDFAEGTAGIRAEIEHVETGERRRIECLYLAGCDGGRSPVRHRLGIVLHGDAVVQRVQSTYIRAPDLLARMRPPLAWGNFSLNTERCGNCYAIDGRERWLIHNYLADSEADFEAVDRDRCIRMILGVGQDFRYEVLGNEDWYGRRLVAGRFRQGRVFLCGDSAHIWVPYAGYGMNAGIADAADLAWLLAARLAGWGREGILDAYEAERLPITEQVSHFAMNHSIAMARQRVGVPDEIEAPGLRGKEARARVGREAYALNVAQYCCAGLNFGYFYDRSPLICYDGKNAPAYTMGTFTSSTVPGCRVPFFGLADGRGLYDALGPFYTLLRFDPGSDVRGLAAAAAKAGVPLAVLDVARGAPGSEVYRHPLLLARPDQHVAWRGERIPDDCTSLVERIRGGYANGAVGWKAKAGALPLDPAKGKPLEPLS